MRTWGCSFYVLDVDDRSTVPEPTHILIVYGADRPGIVFRVCDTLSKRSINITDLNSRLVGSTDDPVYALMLELEVPASEDNGGLMTELTAIAQEMGVVVSLRDAEDDVL